MTLLIGASTIGLILALLAIGVYLSFRIFNFPDITADGSITFGAAVTATLLVHRVSPVLATFAGFVAGVLAGMTTGVLHTKFKINGLLSGILVMTALYSVNLHVMGKSNVPLLNEATLASAAEKLAMKWFSACVEPFHSQLFGCTRKSSFIQKGNVAFSHDVKIDGVEGGHYENAAEEPINPELGMEHASDCSCKGTSNKTSDSGEDRRNMMNKQGSSDRSSESDRPVSSDIRKIKDSEAQINPNGQERKDESDGGSTNEKCHGRFYIRRLNSPIGPSQQAPRMSSVCPTPSNSRSSKSKCMTARADSFPSRLEIVSRRLIFPFGSGR